MKNNKKKAVMRVRFKRALFGYNKNQVDSYIQKMCRDDSEQYEKRLEELAEENVTLAIELKVAKSGYKDAAELLHASEQNAVELKQKIKEIQEKLIALEEQKEMEEQALLEEIEEIREETEKPAHDVNAWIHRLEKTLSKQETQLEQTQKMVEQVIGLREDGLEPAEMQASGNIYESISYIPPMGKAELLESQKKDTEETNNARALMKKLYRIRQDIQEDEKEQQEEKTEE